MSGQLDVFAQQDARARRKDPSTAKDAATEQRGSKAARLSALVLHALHARGPSTSKEIAEYLDEEYVSISPRFRPLERKQIIEEFGKKDGAIVWRIKPSTAMERAS